VPAARAADRPRVFAFGRLVSRASCFGTAGAVWRCGVVASRFVRSSSGAPSHGYRRGSEARILSGWTCMPGGWLWARLMLMVLIAQTRVTP
jgi:hypothetical protein